MADSVETWIDELMSEQTELVKKLRSAIISSHESVIEEFKWGRPCYSANALVCYLKASKKHVTLGFQNGVNLDDPKNLLQGNGKTMRHLKFHSFKDFDETICLSFLKNAFDADQMGA